MTDQDIKDIKNKYDRLIKIKADLLKKNRRIEELEQEATVREYLCLKEQLKSDKQSSFYSVLELSNEEILEKVINELLVANIGQIYVYFGAYKYVDSGSEKIPNFMSISSNDEKVAYKEYKDIEHDLSIGHMVPINECEEFEKENIVLFPSDEENKIEYFNKIRAMYFTTALKYGKEKALEKILYKKNMQQHSSNSL